MVRADFPGLAKQFWGKGRKSIVFLRIMEFFLNKNEITGILISAIS